MGGDPLVEHRLGSSSERRKDIKVDGHCDAGHVVVAWECIHQFVPLEREFRAVPRAFGSAKATDVPVVHRTRRRLSPLDGRAEPASHGRGPSIGADDELCPDLLAHAIVFDNQPAHSLAVPEYRASGGSLSYVDASGRSRPLDEQLIERPAPDG